MVVRVWVTQLDHVVLVLSFKEHSKIDVGGARWRYREIMGFFGIFCTMGHSGGTRWK